MGQRGSLNVNTFGETIDGVASLKSILGGIKAEAEHKNVRIYDNPEIKCTDQKTWKDEFGWTQPEDGSYRYYGYQSGGSYGSAPGAIRTIGKCPKPPK